MTPAYVDPWWHGDISREDWTVAANYWHPLPKQTAEFYRDTDGILKIKWVPVQTNTDYLEAA